MDGCKYRGTSRVGLYFMVFLIFCKVACSPSTEEVKKEVEKLSARIDSLITSKTDTTTFK